MFGLINMNARLYDPVLGRFLSSDPYVQAPEFSQNFNRYSYCLNNPLMYVDQDGEFWWLIGAVIGAYSGGVIANGGQYNPIKWDYSSGKTWGYMLGGTVVGGASAGFGASIASNGGFMANTMGIAGASFMNSVGMAAVTGQTPISISFGVASYDFTNGEWGYLGKKRNKWYENLGYALGALANVSDILTGLRPQGVDLVTEHSDEVGHSALVKEGTSTGVGGSPDPNALISVGPDRINDPSGSWHWMKGTNGWDSHSRAGEVVWRQNLKVNMNTIEKYSNWLNTRAAVGKLIYSVELSSCVTHTSVALNLSGIFNIGIHPYLLNAQMYLWSNGIRPWTFSYFLNH
jgi:RHS repeat-associated protein